MIIDLRKYPRFGINIPVVVSSYLCAAGAFTENTNTLTLSPLGASFVIPRKVAINDILQLSLEMPTQLRLFDFDQPQYQIYAQVRRIKPRTPATTFVGVAFVSKEPPDNDYRTEPRIKYEATMSIRGLAEDGTYFIEIINTEDVSKNGFCFFVSRKRLRAGSIIEVQSFQGKFFATAEVRHVNPTESDKNYRVGAKLLGEPTNWIVK